MPWPTYPLGPLRSGDALPYPPRRIVVAGVSGSGKTTLSGRIAEVLGAPHTEIDSLYHGPDWTPRPEFLADVEAVIAADTWVIEWQYRLARPLLTARADLLVWLDYRYWPVTFPRVVHRTVSRRVRRMPLWNGNVEQPLHTVVYDRDHIVRWSVRTRHKLRDLPTRLADERPELPIVRLRTPGQTRSWLTGPLTSAVRSDQRG